MGDGEVGFSKLNGGMQTFLVVLMIIGAVVPCVLGFVNLDSRQDKLEKSQNDYEEDGDHEWDKVWLKVDGNVTDINQLKLDTQKNTQYYMEIMRLLTDLKDNNNRSFDKLNDKIDTFEVYE